MASTTVDSVGDGSAVRSRAHNQRTATAVQLSGKTKDFLGNGCIGNGPSMGYETLDREPSMMSCPTCNGTGQVPKNDDELVALIPFSDKRLRPRRTCFYVFGAVVFCLIAFSLILFFLLPRNVTLSSDSQTLKAAAVYGFDIRQKVPRKLVVTVNVTVNLTNNNYYKISVTNSTVEALRLRKSLGLKAHVEAVSVPALSVTQLTLPYNVTMEDYYDILRCIGNYPELRESLAILSADFQVTVWFDGMWNSQQNYLSTSQLFYCQMLPMPTFPVVTASTTTSRPRTLSTAATNLSFYSLN